MIFKENNIPHGHDGEIKQGIPTKIDFVVREYTTFIELRAPGYGLDPYGGGALYLSKKEYINLKKEHIEEEE